MAGERGRWPGGAFFGVIAGNVNPRYLLLFCAVLLIVLVGTLYPMITACWAGDASPLAHRILTARLTVWSVDAGGDCAGDVCLWQRAQLPALLAHAGVLLFAAGMLSPASAVRRSA